VKIAVIVLTFNESLHIRRCLESVAPFATEMLVVDSHSTDDTREIATTKGAKVISNPWTNHATQFNFGLGLVARDVDWVFRLDADEYVTPQLATTLAALLGEVSRDVDGIYIWRELVFLGRKIQHGGLFPLKVLRIFRPSRGSCENRWMDEHIVVQGGTTAFDESIVDHNLQSLTWWTRKHNDYASREAIDLLNLEYGFIEGSSAHVDSVKGGERTKRFLKEKIYSRLPSGLRAFFYFIYRYIFRLGFLDGKAGTVFCVLQAFWYRYLVDAKVAEIKRLMVAEKVDVRSAIQRETGIRL
jgi:glycosyltransferase involved in cell wall biosynthesis